MTTADIGVYGLGTMGRALALNLAESGACVAVTNRETEWIDPMVQDAGLLADRLVPCHDLQSFIASLKAPRLILFMIPSGPPMDDMLADVRPLLSDGDTLIDGGNADFHDTRRRAKALASTGVNYIGMGVSGGEEGARHGPSLMVGGDDAGWARLRPYAQAIAARYQDDACVAHVGGDGAGHFVKTVHNGIEYADMQMIAEIYGVLRDAAGWQAARIGELFADWQTGALSSFLIEITAQALRVRDAETGRPLVDMIRDQAGQKGTGRWTVIEALKLGQSASVIAAAVDARNWSSEIDLRMQADARFADHRPATARPDIASDTLADALLAGRIIGHTQGFLLLDAAADDYGWALDKARIAEIWRAGCIIRSALLDDIAHGFRAGAPSGVLILAPALAERLARCIPALRQVVQMAVAQGVAAPALSAALAWYDSMTRVRGTANLIQAQRDIFGRHGFERIDTHGKTNGNWDL